MDTHSEYTQNTEHVCACGPHILEHSWDALECIPAGVRRRLHTGVNSVAIFRTQRYPEGTGFPVNRLVNRLNYRQHNSVSRLIMLLFFEDSNLRLICLALTRAALMPMCLDVFDHANASRLEMLSHDCWTSRLVVSRVVKRERFSWKSID